MSRGLVLFIIIAGLGVGAFLVYANSMKSSNKPTTQTLGTNIDNVSPTPVFQENTTDANTSNTNAYQNNSQNVSQDQNSSVQQSSQNSNQNPPSSLPPYPDSNITQLLTKDERVGTGDPVKSGDTVAVNYIGTFLDGKKFDSSYDRNQPFSFTVGAGQVIQGWDQGLVGMQVGGKRLLVIPSDMAYGPTGSEGAIPPNTPLMFEIELLGIKPAQ